MKKILSMLVLVISIVMTACGARKNIPSSAPFQIVPATSSGDSPAPEVATTLPDNSGPSTGSIQPPPVVQPASAAEIVFQDNGKTFTYHIGGSFLLHLGTDIYDWEVTIADQNIFRMKMGVAVIRGAQGIYETPASGTTTLTAIGNPKCLNSTPPCGMPTILFKVTLVVE